MRAFLLDVWSDLRQKRLWPVAAILVAAAIAVPVLVIGPVPEESAAPSAAAPAAADAALVDPLAAPQGGSSSLDSFKSKDPFESGIDPEDTETDAVGSAGTEIDRGEDAATGDAGDLAAPTSSSATDPLDLSAGSPSGDSVGGAPSGPSGSASSAPGPDSGSGAPGPGSGSEAPGSGSGGPGSGSGGGTGDPRGGETETRYFTYEVDVVYGPVGSTRDFDGLKTFDVLTERNPRLLFLGADDTGRSATFSVLDEDLRERGDGRCVTVNGQCKVLFLKRGEEHFLIDPDSDDRYRIRLTDIREVELDK